MERGPIEANHNNQGTPIIPRAALHDKEENRMEMMHISKADFDRIGADYKGVYMDYQGTHPQRKGRRVAFLPGHGTTLYTEGIHFVVDDDCTHLPVLCKENAEEGAAYQFGGSILYVHRIYRIGEEYANDNSLLYLDRVETSIGDFALPGSDTISTSKNWKIYNVARA